MLPKKTEMSNMKGANHINVRKFCKNNTEPKETTEPKLAEETSEAWV